MITPLYGTETVQDKASLGNVVVDWEIDKGTSEGRQGSKNDLSISICVVASS